MKKYIIKLSAKERKRLADITRKGKHGARVIKRARVLLAADAGTGDEQIARDVDLNSRTIQRIRGRYKAGGFEQAVYDAPRPGTPRALSDEAEAHLVAIACTDPPEGHTHWTMELLRERMISDGTVDSVAVGTIHARLTERGIKPWREKNVVRAEAHA
jgi:transposase